MTEVDSYVHLFTGSTEELLFNKWFFFNGEEQDLM